ncbi:MAG: signal peptide peptidase SppA [Phycisphaeraceae bacterium]
MTEPFDPTTGPGSSESPHDRPAVDPGGAFQPPTPPPGYPPVAYPPPAPPKPRGGILTRVITGLLTTLLIFSIVLNFYLGGIVFRMTTGPTESVYLEGDHDQRIVILPVRGAIGKEQAAFVRDALMVLKKKPPVAVILRVDSPGGGIAASDRIAHLLEMFRADTGKPIVASFGSIAASGGYYIAAGSDYIIAEPTTITGSIGVIAQGFTIGELLNKIGVKPETVTSTEAVKKDVLDWTRDWTDEDRELLRRFLDSGQERFVQVVLKGRPQMSEQDVKQVATGEPFTAQQALQHKLIDGEGYIEDAIEQAKKLAGLAASDRPEVTVISPPRSLLDTIMGTSSSPLDGPTISGEQVRRVLTELATPKLEYRLNVFEP